MTKRCKVISNFFKYIDMYGKEPNLYYKGEEKIKSVVGGIFTLIYILLYLGYTGYKLYRFYKKSDFTTYDTFSYQEKEPSVKLSRDIFYGGFGIEDQSNYDPFIDDTIYYPKAFFRTKDRKNKHFRQPEWV